jgi:hypothetical protein
MINFSKKGTTMSLIKIEPALRDMIHGLGSNPEMEAVKIFNSPSPMSYVP